MLNITKETNQYYGKFFENAVASIINNETIVNKTGYDNFTSEDINQMIDDAKICAKYLNGTKCEWVGNQTSNANCDIIIDDNEHIELKYVSSGTGTYFNTSIYYFTKFGFDFKEYMNNNNYYDIFKDNGFNYSLKNNSPVNVKESKNIRHNYSNIWEKEIKPADEKIRQQFIDDLVKYFNNHHDCLYTFISDMLNKNTETVNKTAPDKIIVFNYKEKEIYEVNPNNQIEEGNISNTDKSIKIDNIRIAIGWQNGNGLNNPTIRVFLRR